MSILKRARRTLIPVFATLVAVGVAACGQSSTREATRPEPKPAAADAAPTPVTGNFVGRVEGTDALVAVVVGERSAVAYVCDSAQMVGGFKGRAGGDALRLDAMEGSGAAEIQLTDSLASGTVVVKGTPYRFAAQRAPAHAGYFFAPGTMGGEPFEARWIVAPDGETRGAVLIRNVGGIVGFAEYGIDVQAEAGLPVRVVADSTTTVRQVVPEPTATTDTQVSVDYVDGDGRY